ALGSHDANFFRAHLDALSERAQVVAAVAARLGAHAPAGGPGKRLESGWCDGRPQPIPRTLGLLSVGAGPGADGPELGHALLEHRIGDIGDAVLDRVVEALELGVRFGGTLAQFGDMRRSALSTLLAAVEHRRPDFLAASGLPKPML